MCFCFQAPNQPIELHTLSGNVFRDKPIPDGFSRGPVVHELEKPVRFFGIVHIRYKCVELVLRD